MLDAPMGSTLVANLYDYIPVFLAIAYLVSLLRDWRPIRSLREENRELRRQVDEQGEKYNELERQHRELEVKYQALEKSRDFEKAFEPLARAITEHTAVISTLVATIQGGMSDHSGA